MSPVVTRFLSDTLRLSLAALVLLAGLAGGRMQGQMAAGASPGPLAWLCSGAVAAGEPLQLPVDHNHDQCLVCHVASASLAPVVELHAPQWQALRLITSGATLGVPGQSSNSYLARGPPVSA